LKRIFTSTIVWIYVLHCLAQFSITGRVADIKNESINGVVVKAMNGKTMLGFATTTPQGIYTIHVKNRQLPQILTIIFSHITYENESVEIKQPKTNTIHQNMILVQKNITLREIKVKANPLNIKGDTLGYNLASFLGKGDVSLEDGLKRIPGVEVSENGSIAYMGMPISAFHIEGLNMLDGKYTLATRNIPAQLATQVEILRNYHERKIDKDKPSDLVAINIKLSKRAKFKPFGQEELGTGYMQGGIDKRLGKLGLTGMLFTNKFQTICSGKIGNVSDYAAADMTYHFSEIASNTAAQILFPTFGGNGPSIGEYLHQRNGMLTVNTINRLDSTSTFKTNIDYSYHRQTSTQETSSTYLENNGKSQMNINEMTSPLITVHQPTITAKYTDNSSLYYLCDNIMAKAKFEQNDGDVIYNNIIAKQHRKSNSFAVENMFSISKNAGKRKFYFYSQIAFRRTPSLRLSFCNNDSAYGQTAQSTSINTYHSTGIDINLSHKLILNLPISILADYDYVETVRIPSGDMNHVSGTTVIISLSPGFEVHNKNQKLYFKVSLPLSFRMMNYAPACLNKVIANPNMQLNYILDANNKFVLSSTFNHHTGDMLSLLTNPMQTDYRSTNAASGIIGETSDWSSTFDWKSEKPLQYFSLHLNTWYTNTFRNQIYSQSISGTDISTSTLFHDTRSQNVGVKLILSKSIPSLLTKVNIINVYQIGKSEQTVNQIIVPIHDNAYSVNCNIAVSPLQWLELKECASFSEHRSRYNETNNKVNSLSNNGEIHIFPIPQLDISAKYLYTHQQIQTNRYKNMTLLNASAQYKFKHAVLHLDLTNLLNQQSYAYTVYEGINKFSYNYALCGRTIMATISFPI
jgi:hypothetical protein